MMRIVVDNNIFVSAFIKGGKPLQVLETVGHGQAILCTTIAIMQQLRQVLLRPKFKPYFEARGLDIESELLAYESIAQHVTPIPLPADLVSDPEDLKFLECAVGGMANYLVTGDDHLLTLGSYQSVLILKSAQFLDLIQPPHSSPET